MSDEVKPSTLEPTHDPELLEMSGQLISEHHPDLDEAVIRWFWAKDKPATFWGRTRVVSEETWWLSGGLERGGCDIAIQVNEALWKKLTEAGRRGLLDVRLARVTRKTGGKTEMETSEGTRLLYEETEGSLGLNPEVLARNPGFVAEIEELRRLHCALATPAQYELQFPSHAPEDGDPEEEDPDPREGAPEREPAEPQFYYRGFRFPAADGDVEEVSMRFLEADHRPSSLAGVYVHPGEFAARPFSERSVVNRGILDYDTRPETIRSFREQLEELLESRKVEALAKTRSGEAGGDEGELAAAGGSVTPIRGRGARG